MHPHSILSTTAALVALASALPLNINLGAYSPALVVGDGAISFEEGGEAVTNLVETLQGAAASSGAAVASAASAPAAEDVTAGIAQAAVVPSSSSPILIEEAGFPIPGSKSKELDPRVRDNTIAARDVEEEEKPIKEAAAAVQKRQPDLSGFDRALTFAEAALTKGPDIQLGTGAEGSGVGIIVDNHQAGDLPR
ncbi:hypothetical protein B0T17DRAFT_504380 [Bombardia bombarda]|uniref:Uncharacterized protein n=1 Tax=Bombardia bombarda TaxID=252184 RepID=A0AA40CH31_9PEZI|nr:hypothetical protein B0T17DRAFT_504380 [Bombardia bombarda]